MMKLSSIASLAVIGSTYATTKGFNIAAERPDGKIYIYTNLRLGSCKAQADWENNFNVMKSLPGTFRFVRLYASSDCDTLANAVPAALNTGIKLLVGIWTENSDHYNAEKIALQSAIKQYGMGWISAISVGSEDLYRGDTTARTLSGQIFEIRTQMSNIGGKGIPIGHVDTWTAWVNSANADVIKACDFVGFDGYPYYQNVNIAKAKNVFDQSIEATKNAIAVYNPGVPLWITETGWPTAGPTMGQAVPSVANAQSYWKNVWCSYPNAVAYAYTLRDYQVAPSAPAFGVVGQNFAPLYNMAC